MGDTGGTPQPIDQKKQQAASGQDGKKDGQSFTKPVQRYQKDDGKESIDDILPQARNGFSCNQGLNILVVESMVVFGHIM